MAELKMGTHSKRSKVLSMELRIGYDCNKLTLKMTTTTAAAPVLGPLRSEVFLNYFCHLIDILKNHFWAAVLNASYQCLPSSFFCTVP